MTRSVSILAAVGAIVALAAPAYAHAMLDRAVPAVGAVVHAAPTEIRLEFSEGVEAVLSRVSLTDEQGKAIPLGPATTAKGDRRILVTPVSGALSPGAYRVTWRVVSVDSHVTQGDFSFTVRP